MSKEKSPLTVITGKVRFSYLTVNEPKAMVEGGEKKFSTQILIPKSDKATIKAITDAINAAVVAKWADKKPKKLKLPLRDGDTDENYAGDETYAGMMFLNANNKNRPYVVNKDKQEIIDKDEIYSGMFGRASLNFFAFDNAGNIGVGVGLNGIMKTSEGDPLGSRHTAEDDFADIEIDEEEDEPNLD